METDIYPSLWKLQSAHVSTVPDAAGPHGKGHQERWRSGTLPGGKGAKASISWSWGIGYIWHLSASPGIVPKWEIRLGLMVLPKLPCYGGKSFTSQWNVVLCLYQEQYCNWGIFTGKHERNKWNYFVGIYPYKWRHLISPLTYKHPIW